MHDKNNDKNSFTKLGKYLLNGILFDSIAKSCILEPNQKSMVEHF